MKGKQCIAEALCTYKHRGSMFLPSDGRLELEDISIAKPLAGVHARRSCGKSVSYALNRSPMSDNCAPSD
jgi:hypothetical protein